MSIKEFLLVLVFMFEWSDRPSNDKAFTLMVSFYIQGEQAGGDIQIASQGKGCFILTILKNTFKDANQHF